MKTWVYKLSQEEFDFCFSHVASKDCLRFLQGYEN